MIAFRIVSAHPVEHAVSPAIAFRIALSSRDAVRGILLQTDVRIEAARRGYSREESGRLGDLFGEPSRHRSTVRPLPWAQLAIFVPPFESAHELEVSVPCSNDLDLAATKYVHAIREGELPILFQFRGTVFRDGPSGLAVSQLAWSSEAPFALPAAAIRAAVEACYPGQAYLRVSRPTIDALLALKAKRCVADFDTLLSDLAREASS